MPRPHFYANLDKDVSVSVEIPMRELAERVERLNYGVHRLLSHLIDVRRETLQRSIQAYEASGDSDVADYVRRQGDEFADGLEALLNKGVC
jgi:hypothetical protein